jgi:hypothetical protein
MLTHSDWRSSRRAEVIEGMSGARVPWRRERAPLFIVMLAGGLLLVGCFASPAAQNTPTTFAESHVSTPPSGVSLSLSAESPPPLNRLEVKVIDALARLGITGQRAELPFENAEIWARVGTGHLFVSAGPTRTRGGDFTVIDRRQLEGIPVQRVEYGGPPLRHRFACSSDTFEVRGAVPPGFTDMDAFVARFIRALGCGA